jgi:hypothetical protein
VAIPPPETLFTSNLTKARRAAELGWVRPWQASAAIRTAESMARRGEHGDAFEILVRRRKLRAEVVAAIERDEEAPAPPTWLFWRRLGRGLFGTWNAPAAALVAALYEAKKPGVASNDVSQQERALVELRRRFRLGGEAERGEIYAAAVAYRIRQSRAPEPIASLLDEWMASGAAVPDEIIRGLFAHQQPRMRILAILFARLPRARIPLAVELALSETSGPIPLAGAWLDEPAADPLAPLAPLIAARTETAWRKAILDVEAEVQRRRAAGEPNARNDLIAIAGEQERRPRPVQTERLEDWFLRACSGEWGDGLRARLSNGGLEKKPASVRVLADVAVEIALYFPSPSRVAIFELTLDDGSRRFGYLVRCVSDERVEHEHAGVVPAEDANVLRRPRSYDVDGLVAYALADLPPPLG